MILKNNLKTQKAQSSVEYLMLFAIIAVLTLLSLSQLFPSLRETMEETSDGNIVPGGFFDKAMQAMH